MHFLYDQISALLADDSVAKLEIGAQISVIGKLLKEGQFITKKNPESSFSNRQEEFFNFSRSFTIKHSC